MTRRPQFSDVPMLPVLVAVVIGILVCFPRDFREAPIPYVSQAADNMRYVRSLLLQRYADAGMRDDAYSMLAAMTLGDKAALSDDVRQLYNTTGASHVLALSGLHLSILYMLLSLLIPNRRWRMVSQVVTILAVWAYAFLTGLSPSIVRAATMLTVYSLLAVGYRERNGINVLFFTAFVMLIASPTALYNVGFQMSFLAVGGILLFNPLINELIAPHVQQRHTLLKWTWGLTTVSLSAQIGVAPLIAFYFHRLPTYFLLSNFVVVPLAWTLLIGGMLLMAVPSGLLASLLSAAVSLANTLLDRIASLPLSNITDLHPNALQVVMTYIVIGCIYILATIIIPKQQWQQT